MKEKNIIILSMGRCGVSWVFSTISQIYEKLYGKKLPIIYENDRAKVSHTLINGWTGVYNINPKILLNLGYDKILIIKRNLESLKKAHAQYHGYQENYQSYEEMVEKRSGFFEKIELWYNEIYNQKINDSHVLIVNLEDLNNYTNDSFRKIIEFLEFKLSFIQKIRLFLRVLRNKVHPLVIPVNPTDRDWDVYSAQLPIGHELCNRLEYIKKIKQKI